MPDARLFYNLRFHDLRHEAVTRLFETGLNMIEVASISGHKSLQMLRRYTHLQASDLAEKLNRLPRATIDEEQSLSVERRDLGYRD